MTFSSSSPAPWGPRHPTTTRHHHHHHHHHHPHDRECRVCFSRSALSARPLAAFARVAASASDPSSLSSRASSRSGCRSSSSRRRLSRRPGRGTSLSRAPRPRRTCSASAPPCRYGRPSLTGAPVALSGSCTPAANRKMRMDCSGLFRFEILFIYNL